MRHRRPDVARALAGVPDGEPVIVLAHDPDVFPFVPARVALTVCGHTHGGQIAIPLVRRPVIPSRHGERFARGHIVEHGRHLLVEHGPGHERPADPAVRAARADRARIAPGAAMTERRLLTIPISHFCEKARWALERAGLAYREERHVQGVNRIVSKRRRRPRDAARAGLRDRRAGGVRGDPALRRRAPARSRGGCSRTAQEEIAALCRELDAGLGPDGRRLMYAHMLPRKDFMLEFNDVGVPRWEDVMMRRLWPVVARWGAAELEVRDDTLEQDRPRVLAAFDAIAARLEDGRPYLFGERFTAADLTFAALAAAVVAAARVRHAAAAARRAPGAGRARRRGLPRAPGGRIRAADVPRPSPGRGRLISIVGAMPDVLRPLFDQVVIKELEPDRMRKSGLLVPEGTADVPPNEGIVLAAGDGPPDLPDFKMPVKPGDHVVFPRSAGVWVEVEDERLLVCRVREILGVIEDGTTR